MPRHPSTFSRSLGLSLALFLGAGWGTAQAVSVSIGGTVYDVQLTAGGSTYLSVRDDVMAAPWWGSQALAEEAAINFHTATGGDYGISAGTTDAAVFIFAEPVNPGPRWGHFPV